VVVVESEAENLLRNSSLRVTRPRVTVISVIYEIPHLDVKSIFAEVVKRIGTVSMQTVYGALDTLVAARLARRIDLPGLPALYEGQTSDDHQHAVCRNCGTIADVEENQRVMGPGVVHKHGFTVDEVDVTYWGICPECTQNDLNQGATNVR